MCIRDRLRRQLTVKIFFQTAKFLQNFPIQMPNTSVYRTCSIWIQKFNGGYHFEVNFILNKEMEDLFIPKIFIRSHQKLKVLEVDQLFDHFQNDSCRRS